MKEKNKKLTEEKCFTKDKKTKLLVILLKNIITINTANDEQEQSAIIKTITSNRNTRKEKKDINNSARTHLRGRELAFRAFESKIFLLPTDYCYYCSKTIVLKNQNNCNNEKHPNN